jgi:hypothetical protein
LTKAAAKGNAEINVGTEDSLHGKGTASGQVKAKAEAQVRGGAGVFTNKEGEIEAAYVDVQAKTRAAVEVSGKSEAEVAYGESVKGKVGVAGKAQVEAEAHARAAASASKTGVTGSGSVGAGLSATAGGVVEVEFDVKDLGLDVQLAGAVEAALRAKAEGDFKVTKSGVDVGWEAEAMAGVSAAATGKAAAKLYGRDVLSMKGSVGTHAGYVYGSTGRFTAQGGKIRIKMGLAASPGLPVGAKAELEPSVDFKPLAVYVARQMAKASWEATKAQQVIQDPTAAKALLVQDLKAYSDDKRQKLATKDAENYVKREKVQQYVEQRFPVDFFKNDTTNSSRMDAIIKAAIEETLVPKAGKKVEATVSRGKVKEIKNLAWEGPKDGDPEATIVGTPVEIEVGHGGEGGGGTG